MAAAPFPGARATTTPATETTTLTGSEYDTYSLGLGTNGTIATSSTTSAYSDSQSDLDSGTEVTTDSTGGAPLAGTYTQTSITTSYV
jgi:hypothetical protein